MKGLIIEYLIYTGALTGTLQPGDIRNDGAGDYIAVWNFPEPQPDWAAVEASAGFQDYVANLPIIKDRERAIKKFDTEDRRFALILLDEINILRKRDDDIRSIIADPTTTTLAILKTRVTALPVMQPRTIAQLKAAMNLKD